MTMRKIVPMLGFAAILLASAAPFAVAQEQGGDPDAAYIPPPPPGIADNGGRPVYAPSIMLKEAPPPPSAVKRAVVVPVAEMDPAIVDSADPSAEPTTPMSRSSAAVPADEPTPPVAPPVPETAPPAAQADAERPQDEQTASESAQIIVAPVGEPDETVVAPDQTAAAPRDFQPLEEVLRTSYIDNPTLRAARAELKATHERLPQAQAGWKPTLSGEASVTWADIDQSPPAAGGADGTTSKKAGVSAAQALYRGGRTVAAVDGAENLIKAQRAILNATEQRIMRDVATAYMDVVRDLALLELRNNNKAVIARQLEATRDRFEVGELTRTDVSQAEARLARAEADRTRALGDLRTSRSVYAQLTGVPPGSLGYPQLSFAIPPDLDGAIARASTDNPAVIASEYRHRAAEKDIDGVFGELLPFIQLFGSWDREYDPQPGLTDDVTTAAVGISASIPFYTGGAVRSRVRQAKYTANQQFIGIMETRRQATQETVENWETLKAAQAEIRSREAQVEAASVAREGVYQEAELGARTILDTLDADQEYLDAQVALVTARRNETVATFFLAATLGLLTPDNLGFPDVQEDYDAHLAWTESRVLGMSVDTEQ